MQKKTELIKLIAIKDFWPTKNIKVKKGEEGLLPLNLYLEYMPGIAQYWKPIGSYNKQIKQT